MTLNTDVIPIHPLDLCALLEADDGPIDVIICTDPKDGFETQTVWGQKYFQTPEIPVISARGRELAKECKVPTNGAKYNPEMDEIAAESVG